MAIDINPTGTLAYAFLAITRVMQRRLEEALSLAERETHEVFRNVALAVVHRAAGREAQSAKAFHALIDGFAWTAAYQVAEVYAYRGEIDKAFEWLETAFLQNDPGVIYSGSDPFLAPLHEDARWATFVARLGFDRPTH
jgi:tetratricopeptide (TPR) repeat protein